MILVLTGAVHSGKTTFLRELLPSLKSLGLPVCGYLSPLVMVKGRAAGYDLYDIRKARSTPFLRTEGMAGWQRTGPYFFLPRGLETAAEAIVGQRPGEMLIVDEVGPMELSGRGVWPALKEVLSRPAFNCLLVARRSLVGDLRRQLGNQQVEVFDIAANDVFSALLRRLSEIAASSRARKPIQRSQARS